MSEQAQPLFTPRILVLVIAVGALLLLSSLYFLGEPRPERRLGLHGARPTSTSAIGYRGLVDLLRDVGVAVELSGRLPTDHALGKRLLIITDQEALIADKAVVDRLSGAEQALVILPKWQGRADPWRRGWLGQARLLDEAYPRAVLADLGLDAELARPEAVSGWSLGPLPSEPTLPWPQLIQSDRLTPVIASDQGTLLGHWRGGGRDLWLLSDPDLLSNHGLRRQPDPEILGASLRHILGLAPEAALSASPGVLFIDLTLKSEPPPSNLFAALFEFPTVIVTLQVAIACLMAGWAATGRFGRPEAAARALPPGKRVLVDNAAALLRVGAHHRNVVRRYFEITAERAAQRLNAPRGLNQTARFEWLCRTSERRGLAANGERLKARIDRETGKPLSEARAIDLAQHCDRWKRELLHESGDDPRNR